jgi:hypothetical protein
MARIWTPALALAAGMLLVASAASAAGPVAPTPKAGLGTASSTPAGSTGKLPSPTIPSQASSQTVPGGLSIGQGTGTAKSTPASATPASGHIGTGK